MKKQLQCPCCNSRLIDEHNKTVSKAKLVMQTDQEIADYYLKCNVCKNEIAIKKLN